MRSHGVVTGALLCCPLYSSHDALYMHALHCLLGGELDSKKSRDRRQYTQVFNRAVEREKRQAQPEGRGHGEQRHTADQEAQLDGSERGCGRRFLGLYVRRSGYEDEPSSYRHDRKDER